MEKSDIARISMAAAKIIYKQETWRIHQHFWLPEMLHECYRSVKKVQKKAGRALPAHLVY